MGEDAQRSQVAAALRQGLGVSGESWEMGRELTSSEWTAPAQTCCSSSSCSTRPSGPRRARRSTMFGSGQALLWRGLERESRCQEQELIGRFPALESSHEMTTRQRDGIVEGPPPQQAKPPAWSNGPRPQQPQPVFQQNRGPPPGMGFGGGRGPPGPHGGPPPGGRPYGGPGGPPGGPGGAPFRPPGPGPGGFQPRPALGSGPGGNRGPGGGAPPPPFKLAPGGGGGLPPRPGLPPPPGGLRLAGGMRPTSGPSFGGGGGPPGNKRPGDEQWRQQDKRPRKDAGLPY